MTRVYVPRDAAALAVGADEVAAALVAGCAQRGQPLELVRNGSRGMFWLETLVEVDTPQGRVAYGPVSVDDVAGLLDAGLLAGAPHALGHGLTAAIPYLARQQRLTFARVGVTDPLSLADYEAHGGWAGLRRARALARTDVVEQVLQSGLRGRGGAAFPAGVKWKTVAAQAAPVKYVVCNADEGDSGTFSDRMVMEGDPYMLIEGMAIAAHAVGATQGYVYIRSEYPHAVAVMEEAIRRAEAAGWLSTDFRLEVRIGAGSYVCGEETAMLESIEGKRGIVRSKPPLPAIEGLFGQPTVINNVITFASVPIILAQGAAFYAGYGTGRSRGTLPIQLAGNVRRGGLVELAFGTTLRELVFDFGGGTRSGRPVKAIQAPAKHRDPAPAISTSGTRAAMAATASAAIALTLALTALQVSSQETTRRLRSVLDLFPRLQDRKGQVVGTMSGGEQRMVAIGMGLMTEPRVLLLDEPTTGLAPSVVHQLMALIQRLNSERGITTVVVEQNILSLLKIAHSLVVVKNGRCAVYPGLPSSISKEDVIGIL